MRFPVHFTRFKGAAGTALGSDTLPSGRALVKADNLLASTKVSINGWPISRLVFAAKYTGGGAAAKLPVSMFVFEDELNMWLPLPGSDTGITPGTTAAPLPPIFFDVMALNDLPITGGESGSCSFLAVVSDNASGNGQYDFAMATELTTKPF